MMIDDTIKEQLQRFLPIRIVLSLSDQGKVQGLVEHSFHMDQDSKFTRIWWSGKAFSNFGTEHDLNGIADAEYNAENGVMFDPLDENCPVTVDWKAWLAAKDKFHKRNAPFVVKPFGEYVLHTHIAERNIDALNGRVDALKERAERAEQRLSEYYEREQKVLSILRPGSQGE